MQEVEHLLKEVSRQLKEFDAVHENKRVTEHFNVFEALGVEADERKICRFLCKILEREFFLKSFVRKVLELDIPDYKLEQAEVYIEYYTQNGRKIDIVIRINSKKLFIPIEVKIWAWDLNEQCKDYYEEAKKYDDDAKIFYLTPDGHAPSPESSYGVPAEDMKCISFKNDIYDWISYCIGQPEVIRNAPLREVLLQFAETVKKFTEQQTKEEKLKMEIAEFIRESPENMKAALHILAAKGEIIAKLRTDFFKAVEEAMKAEKEAMVDDNSTLYYGIDKRRTGDYFAGLFYAPSKKEGKYDDTKPGVRLDIDNGLAYIGVFTPREGKNGKWGNFIDCTLSNGKFPNFKNPNDALFELCDESVMKDFAEKCAREIKSYLKELETA